MGFLAGADAVIIDLRHNGGGNPSMIQLLSSYLFEEPVHLNSFFHRGQEQIDQFWTLPHVPGTRFPDTPLYILTSSYTFSAAEEFTYNLKHLKRATIVGEVTGGGAHPGGTFGIQGGFSIFIPTGRAINPITKTNWEGTGIEPHVKTSADEALLVAHMQALETLSENAEGAHEHDLTWALRGLRAKRERITLSSTELAQYVGTYGPRLISVDGGSLYYKRHGRPQRRLVPLGEHLFGLEGDDRFRMQFEIEEGGRAASLTGLYKDGRRERNERDTSTPTPRGSR